MTSLFSHSLLNDTDRDVRGAYRAFSRGTVHASLPGKGSNDRASANVSLPRKNYAVVAKEMAKTQSLAASFRNITQYLSLIERARNTIQGIEAKLTELDQAIVSEAAGLIDNDDYNSVSVGAIAGASISGASQVAQGDLLLFRPRQQVVMELELRSQSSVMAEAIMKLKILMQMAGAMRLTTRLLLPAQHLVASPTAMMHPSQSMTSAH